MRFRLKLPRQAARRGRITTSASLAVGAGVVAAAAGVLWRTFNGGAPATAPDHIAALTAQAVHDAARESVLDAIEDGAGEPEERLRTAAAQAVREAGLAGADVTAAAVGAIEGASIAARDHQIVRAVALEAARDGARDAARRIGTPAFDRVQRVLQGRQL